MKRLRLLLIAAAMMAAFFITPASALEYTFDSPSTRTRIRAKTAPLSRPALERPPATSPTPANF